MLNEGFMGADDGVAFGDGFGLIENADGFHAARDEELGEHHAFIAGGHLVEVPEFEHAGQVGGHTEDSNWGGVI